ncbi:FG-GAP-like repeat-containing protein [Arcticibacter tournemirensis]|uniref:IPT/TIG domain-containing protein n=1 Tax=Arcticibacter tournemirensis TaxID=699437 RepID=A0A4Q0M510_9SPHI|nr:FG-GAP-like repeat-containing protein [Arcticibacter tournemirensis]RXF67746.1 hypothetical protein EKH83_18140 [Arcticibacter tournemirensis]
MSKSLFLLVLMVANLAAVYAQGPLISSFAPKKGPVGTEVRILGRYFNTSAAGNIVYFGAVEAKVKSATSTEITVIAPASASYDPISVLNTQNKRTGYSTVPFIVTAESKNSFGPADVDPKVTINAGIYSTAMAIGDVDGDGKPDVVLADYRGKLSVMRNVSSRGIVNSSSLSTGLELASGDYPSSVVLQDMDGDGKLDIVVGYKKAGNISIYKNRSIKGSITSDSFDSRVDINTGGFIVPVIATGDVDGDGRPDIIGLQGGNLVIFVNEINNSISPASFTRRVSFKLDTSIGENSSIAVADLDADGRLDITVAPGDYSSSVLVFHNVGSNVGMMTDKDLVMTRYTTGKNAYSVVTADLNEDGRSEILVADQLDNTVSVLLNQTNGAEITSSSFSTRLKLAVGVKPTVVCVADIDGDGLPDIMASNNSSHTVSVIKNNSSSGLLTQDSFSAKSDFATTEYGTSLKSADMDGDGRTDIVWASYMASIIILRNNPSNPPVITSFIPKLGPVGTAITVEGSNFNTVASKNIVWFGATRGNVVSASSNKITIKVPPGASFEPFSVLNTETGRAGVSSSPFITTFSSARDICNDDFETSDYSKYGGDATIGHEVKDMDSDGKPDLVMYERGGKDIVIFTNVTDPETRLGDTFDGERMVIPIGTNISDLKITDVDGDGSLDIIVLKNAEKTLSIYRNISSSGDFKFDVPKTYPTGGRGSLLVVADFNGDGKPDILSGAGDDYSDRSFKNTSTAGLISFAVNTDVNYGGNWTNSIAADIDQDGKPDLVRADYPSARIYRNVSADGVIAFAKPVDLKVEIDRLQAADIDQDGKTDMIMAGSHVISVLRNTATKGVIDAQSFAAPKDFAIGGYCSAISVSDLNGDGKPDIIAATADWNIGRAVILQNNSNEDSIDFKDRVTLAVRYEATGLVVCDVDMDNRPDVLATTPYNLWIYYNHPLDASAYTRPVITSVSPNSAVAGETITIEGENFNPGASKNLVRFGAVAATVSSATTNSLTLKVPKGASSATISVSNADNELTAYSPQPFNLTFPGKRSLSHSDFEKTSVIQINGIPGSCTLSDLDGDGKVDLLVSVEHEYILRFYRNVSQSGSISSSSFVQNFELKIYSEGSRVVVTDMNADGKPDILLGGKQIYINHSVAGKFVFDNIVPLGGYEAYAVVADMDHDGKPDIVRREVGSDVIKVLFNTTRNHELSFLSSAEIHWSGQGPFVSDIDGDGKPDIATTSSEDGPTKMMVFRNISKQGNFTGASLADKVIFDFGKFYWQVNFFDIDGDGKSDIFLNGGDRENSTVLRNISVPGKFSFEAPVLLDSTKGGVLNFASIDGDNRRDLLFMNPGGRVKLLRNGSTPGKITSEAFSKFLKLDIGYARTINVNDIDNDGRSDIVIAANDTVSILRYNAAPPDLSDTLTFPLLAHVIYGDPDMVLNASLKSGKMVMYESSDTSVAILTGNKVRIRGTGSTIITAYEPGNADNYVSRTLIVDKASQRLSVESFPAFRKGDEKYLIRASSSSGLSLSIETSNPKVALIERGYLIPLEAGSADITVSQAGDQNYLPAEPLVQTALVVEKEKAVEKLAVHKAMSPDGDGVNDFLLIEGIDKFPDNTVVLTDRNGVKLFEKKGYNNDDKVFDGHSTLNGEVLKPGTYFYFVTYNDNGSTKRESGFFVIRY